MNGVILYRGPSLLDGSPIVVIATYHSGNVKTGDAIQTFILVADMSPRDACDTGLDAGICGDCKHRGIVVDYRNVLRSCYVIIHHAPRAAWAKFARGTYRDLHNDRGRIADAAAGRKVRIGSYGDPAAVPRWVWVALTSRARSWFGYTHQWRLGFALADLCMASTETDADDREAMAMGYRVYRMSDPDAPPVAAAGAVQCPATRPDSRVQCVDCGACGGTSSRVQRPIYVPAHGCAHTKARALVVLQESAAGAASELQGAA